MASPIYLWYTSEVFYWRSLAATFWSIICLPLILFLYLFLSSISMIHPIAWFTDAIFNVMTLNFMFSSVIFGASMVTVTWFSLPYLNVKREIDSSPLVSILGLFRWSRLTLFVICVLNGVLAGWGISQLASSEFNSLSKTLNLGERETQVLNERHLFIVGCGLFTGFCHFCHFFCKKKYHLMFPNIQRLKLFQTRSEMTSLLYSTIWQSLHTIKYYYIMYFLFGGLPKSWINTFFHLPSDYYTTPIDSIKGCFDLSLAWQTFLTSYLIIFTWTMALTLTKIFHTEHIELPITNALEDMKGKTLADALGCSYSPLLQHLAFLDLVWLTKYSSSRVQELFCLSQPGGHPKTWASISELVLNEIWKLNVCVRDANYAILSRVPTNPNKNGVSHSTMYGNSETSINSSVHFRGNDAVPNGVTNKERDIPPSRSLISRLFQSSSRLPILSQLLAETPDTNSQHLFAGCQLQIWAVESFSHVAVRAYNEDSFGVVQGSLSGIFAACLDLNESMEKHFKLTSVTSRRQNGFDASSETMLRYKLHSVLKSALYRMVNTYRPHLQDLNLTQEEIKKLNPFIEYAS